MKDKILKILYSIWAVLIPMLLAIGFSFSCFMGIWKLTGAPLWLAIILFIIISYACIFGLGKMIKIW